MKTSRVFFDQAEPERAHISFVDQPAHLSAATLDALLAGQSALCGKPIPLGGWHMWKSPHVVGGAEMCETCRAEIFRIQRDSAD